MLLLANVNFSVEVELWITADAQLDIQTESTCIDSRRFSIHYHIRINLTFQVVYTPN